MIMVHVNIFRSIIVLIILGTFVPAASQQQAVEDTMSLRVGGKAEVDFLEEHVSLQVNNTTLRDAINRLSQELDLTMVFQDELLEIPGISTTMTERPLYFALNELLHSYGLTYVVTGERTLVIGKMPSDQIQPGAIRGVVTDTGGEVLVGANIMIKDTDIGTTTNRQGVFRFDNLTPGVYTVKFSYIGYLSIEKEVNVRAGELTEISVELKSTIYYIGGIEVVADTELMPRDPETKTFIRSGEIEHMQASSLGDVLQLIPGVASTNPGLVDVQQANLRGSDRDPTGRRISAYGTQIMIDNVPLSNVANMQLDVAPSMVTSDRGIDLRSIPAENIQDIEVVRGIPSARHGDLTEGLISVRTRTGISPNRLRFKYNPNTYEGNFSGGFDAGITDFGYNVNIASSQRDIRRPGDGYTRVALQMSSVNKYFEHDQLRMRNIFYFTRAFDEMKEDPTYALRLAYYNRDIQTRYTFDLDYTVDDMTSFSSVFSMSYTNQDSYNQEMVSRDNLVLSDRMDEGVQEGRFVFGSYLSQYWVEGDVWNLYGKIDGERRIMTGEVMHQISAGVIAQYNVNRGPGRVYDVLFPPGSSRNIGDRPRSYDDLPGITNISAFLENRMSGSLFDMPFTLLTGVRYEMYNPERINFGGLFSGSEKFIEAQQGTFIDPRINFSLNITDNTQFRIGYGRTSKAPPMSMLYPNKRYFDVVDTVAFRPNNPEDSFSIVSTYIFDRGNENLRAYTQTKYEASLDQRIWDVGISLTGFINQTRDGFGRKTEPVTLFQRSWPEWPDQSVYEIKDTLMERIFISDNIFWSDSKGAEMTVRTRRLPTINTVFEFGGAYRRYRSGQDGGVDFGGRRFDTNLNMDVFPIHNSEERFIEEMLLKYRFDVHSETLRMWLTLHVEQQAMERDGFRGRTDSLAIGYFTQGGETVWIPEEERDDEKYVNLRRTRPDYMLLDERRPSRWLFNVRVSKELWAGSEVSFFVNNFFNHRPLYRRKRTDEGTISYERRNPPIYFGLEVSSIIDPLFRRN